LEDTTIKDELKTYQDLWQAKEYQKAKIWLENHPTSFSAETWHYNLGTTEAQLNELPSARYHFEQAYQLGKRDSKVAESLIWIRKELQTEQWETSSAWTDYIYKFLIYRPQYFFSQLTLVTLALGFGLFAIKKITKKIMISFVVAGFLFSCLGLYLSQNIVLITQEPVQSYRGPSKIFDFQEVPAGVMLYLRPYGNTYKVLYPSLAKGWVLKDTKQVIKEGSIWDLMNQN